MVNRPLDVKALTMMHDFAITAEHVIFMDLPIVFNLESRQRQRDMPFRWDDDYGARLGVLRRDDPFGECAGSRSTRATSSTSPTRTTAMGNAIVLQAVRYPELWRGNGGFDAEGVMWTLDDRPGDRHASASSQLDDRAVEFPRIDDRLAGLHARYAVSVGKTAGCATT